MTVFDPRTAELLQSAPGVPGLEADDLPTFTKVVQHVSDDALDEPLAGQCLAEAEHDVAAAIFRADLDGVVEIAVEQFDRALGGIDVGAGLFGGDGDHGHLPCVGARAR